jgi:16S rRNA (cytosine1402-N4)-methyltransferase
MADQVRPLAIGRRRVADCTAGAGGHTVLFLDAGARVMAVDRDPDAIETLRERFRDTDAVVCTQGAFSDAPVLAELTRFAPDLIFADLGVSSYQIDEPTRGFSFQADVPLDMRMNPAAQEDAADILNTWSQAKLHSLFADYADERRAARLAREVVRRRQRASFAVSDDLVNAIRAALGPRSGPADFARIFQAVRIGVNDELQALREALPRWLEALHPGGDIAIVSYHSGEDRIVKHTFREWARACVCEPGVPVCTCRGAPLGEVVTRKPIEPGEDEIRLNARARSAKLRVFRKAM